MSTHDEIAREIADTMRVVTQAIGEAWEKDDTDVRSWAVAAIAAMKRLDAAKPSEDYGMIDDGLRIPGVDIPLPAEDAPDVGLRREIVQGIASLGTVRRLQLARWMLEPNYEVVPKSKPAEDAPKCALCSDPIVERDGRSYCSQCRPVADAPKRCTVCGSEDPEVRGTLRDVVTGALSDCDDPFHDAPKRCPTCGSDDPGRRDDMFGSFACDDSFHDAPLATDQEGVWDGMSHERFNTLLNNTPTPEDRPACKMCGGGNYMISADVGRYHKKGCYGDEFNVPSRIKGA